MDALRHLLSTVSTHSVQLEGILASFWINTDPEQNRFRSTTIADLVWSIIDKTRQMIRVMPFINVVMNQSDEPLIAKIKEFRDSYHHLDERINDYFVNNGHSVFGHISWRERKSAEVKREHHTIMRTGVVRGMSQFSPEAIIDHIEEFRHKVGIFDVNFYYVKKTFSGKGKNKIVQHEQLGIRIDDIVDFINTIVSVLTVQVAAVLLESAMRNNTTIDRMHHYGFLPRTMGLQSRDGEINDEKAPPTP